jgi:hypothetical protein
MTGSGPLSIFARAASVVPNAVTDEIFVRLKKHFSPEQIVEMVAVIALFGWQNRLNDTLHVNRRDSQQRSRRAKRHAVKRPGMGLEASRSCPYSSGRQFHL